MPAFGAGAEKRIFVRREGRYPAQSTKGVPTFGRGIPQFITERQDYLKAIFMGFFPGNGKESLFI